MQTITAYHLTNLHAIDEVIIPAIQYGDGVQDVRANYDVDGIFSECFRFSHHARCYYLAVDEVTFWESIDRNSR